MLSKIAIIGSGAVGSTTAYHLILKDIASQIMLVDINQNKCRGEVEDLADVSHFANSTVTMASLEEAGQADIAIIAAGIPQKPGQSRRDLLPVNKQIVEDIIQGMKPLNEKLILIIVTNPVDYLTYCALKISGLKDNQVFGSGTLLDSQRLRYAISQKLHINQQAIQVSILGEHGDSQVCVWSNGNINGIPLQHFLTQYELSDLAKNAKNKAYSIIEYKGATVFGIASCIATYCENIIYDTKQIVPVSCYSEKYDLCISIPTVLGRNGIERKLMPVLSEQESEQWQKSIALLRKDIDTFRETT